MHDVMEQIRAETSIGVHRSENLAVPAAWEPAYLASRLKEFHMIEARVPWPRGPREFGANWPGYTHSQKEINAYINRDGEPAEVEAMRRAGRADPYQEHRDAFKYTRVSLTALEVSLYDGMLDYLREFGEADRDSRDFLMQDSALVAEGATQQERCIAAGYPLGTFKDVRRRALSAFCKHLNTNGRKVL